MDDASLFTAVYTIIEHAVHPEHAPSMVDPRTSKAAQDVFRLVKKATAGQSATCTKVLQGEKSA